MAVRSFVNGHSDQLLVPCERSFQLRADSTIDEFVEHVLHHVGLTLVKHSQTRSGSGRGNQTEGPVAAWLTSPVLLSVPGSLADDDRGGLGGGTHARVTGVIAGWPNLPHHIVQATLVFVP
jgi:hypothetical protein